MIIWKVETFYIVFGFLLIHFDLLGIGRTGPQKDKKKTHGYMKSLLIWKIALLFDWQIEWLSSKEGLGCAEVISALRGDTIMTIITVIVMSVMNHDVICPEPLTWAAIMRLTERTIGDPLSPGHGAQCRVSLGVEGVHNYLLRSFDLGSTKRTASPTPLRVLDI